MTETPGRRGGMKLLVVASAALFLGACGSGDPEAATEVATLETEASGLEASVVAATVDGVDGAELSPDEAALEFSQCMRDEGLDFPDLSVNANGEIELREAFQTVDRSADGFREAMDSCREVLGQTGFGGGRREAFQSTEMEDALLEFSACVRAEGYDVGDLTLGGPGQGPGAGPDAGANDGDDAAAPAEGQGQQGARQGGFGNRQARFAENLGLDYEDPEVAAVVDGCAVIVDDALAAAGIEQPGS